MDVGTARDSTVLPGTRVAVSRSQAAETHGAAGGAEFEKTASKVGDEEREIYKKRVQR